MNQFNYSAKSNFIKFLLFFFVCLLIKKNSNSQVNLQTGSATFDLPMFSWQDTKSRLNSVVALNYSSGSGLKVNDVASNVGQGWNLLAGGVVTRMQVGEPDDQKEKPGSSNDDITKYPAGYLFATGDPSKGILNAIKNYPIYRAQNILYKQHNLVAEDKELDYFSFTFNGRSGMFFLDKESFNRQTNTVNGISIGDSKMKIVCTIDENWAANWRFRTTIRSFSIQDENGLIYKFGNIKTLLDDSRYLGRTKVLKTNFCDANLSQHLTQPEFEHGGVYHESAFEDPANIKNPYTVDGWYLAEIEDALSRNPDGSKRKISFDYEVRDIKSISGVSFAHYNTGPDGKRKEYIIISHKVSQTQTPVITSIKFPDEHKATFTYNNFRVDLPGDKALSSVDITYRGRPLSKYELKTSYFILNRYGTPVIDYQKRAARLCLLSVKKYGVDLVAAEQPYIFDYYLGSSKGDEFVPPPFFYAKDIWGYFNGNYSRNNGGGEIQLNKSVGDLNYDELAGLCYIRNGVTRTEINPQPGYAKNGLLKQVIYPTGGALNYDYKQNVGLLKGQQTNVGGVHVSDTRSTDGGFSNNCGNPIITNYKYALSDGFTSSLWKVETPVNIITSSNHYAPESKYYTWKPILGSCGYRYEFPGILSKDQAISLTTGQQVMVTLSKILNVVNTITTIMDVANVVGGGSGFFAWAAVIIDIIGNALEVVLTCFVDRSVDSSSMVTYDSDLNAINPLPLQFKRVEVIQHSGGAGKTVHLFTSDEDYPVWEATNPIYSMKQRYAYWVYGLPKLTTVFDAAGKKVRETENLYDPSNAKTEFTVFKTVTKKYPSCKSQVNKSYSQNNTDWEKPDPNTYTNNLVNDDLKAEIYYKITGRYELIETRERVYKLNDDTRFAETKTTFQYSYDNYQVTKISATQSNGDVNYKTITYPYNYQTGALATLYQNNIINIPVATVTSIKKNNGTAELYLNEKVTEFTTAGNGDIKPYRTLEQRFNQPVSSITGYYAPGSTYNPPYKETQTLTYDAAGNLIGMKDEGNHMVSNIYDYDDKYVIASVINADPLIDKPAYTSFETNVYGGWSLGGTPSPPNTSISVTGTRSFGLNSTNNFSASLNSAKGYKVSLWADNGSVRVNGNAGTVKSPQVINGFSYYEFDIPAGTGSVTVSGAANIDELRLYPQTARMRTVSYDPLIGKTSECDENNRITYYEYDELGRLRSIKDDNKHIVKMYEYNYAKQTSCPVTYTNNLITETFTKDNCGAGYIGGNVTYSIPAAKYSSTISQADADQKADNELATYGQAHANTNGTCIKLYYNVAVSKPFTKQNCPVGSVGGTVTYSVPANKYTSTVDQASADKLAQIELKANGQAFANNDATVTCAYSTEPVWQADISTSTRCEIKDGKQTGRLEALMTDINPNSSTYNTQQWKDAGENSTQCPATTTPTVYARRYYENVRTEGNEMKADIVVRLYSDAACSQPVSVNGLTVYYYSSCRTSGTGDCYCSDDIHRWVSITGDHSIIAWGTTIATYYDYYSCNTDYYLEAGAGYTISN